MPSPGGWDMPQPIGVPQNVQNSFSSLAKWINRPWSVWTPVLTATIANPNQGSTGVSTGRFIQLGKTVKARVDLTFGGAGMAAGNGTYTITLPVPAQAAPLSAFGDPIGTGWIWQGLAAQHVIPVQITTTTLQMHNSGGYLGYVTQAVPWAWGAGAGSISLQIEYEAAS